MALEQFAIDHLIDLCSRWTDFDSSLLFESRCLSCGVACHADACHLNYTKIKVIFEKSFFSKYY